MESTGARLKKLRLEKGLSLEEIHKKTKIHLNILKAIEEDNLIGLSPVYIKGFLKIYCKFLGIDPKDYITGFQEPQSQVKIVKEVSISTTRGKPLSLLRIAYGKLSSLRRINIKIKTVFIIILILFLSISLFTLGKFIRSKTESKIQATKLQKSKRQVVTPKGKSFEVMESKSKDVVSVIRLGMRAKEDCWVNLKVDGRLVFHAVLKKGKFESWQAKDKIEFSLGNAGAVELELNSRPIPTLGRRGQVLKSIMITKEEGLKVLR